MTTSTRAARELAAQARQLAAARRQRVPVDVAVDGNTLLAAALEETATLHPDELHYCPATRQPSP